MRCHWLGDLWWCATSGPVHSIIIPQPVWIGCCIYCLDSLSYFSPCTGPYNIHISFDSKGIDSESILAMTWKNLLQINSRHKLHLYNILNTFNKEIKFDSTTVGIIIVVWLEVISLSCVVSWCSISLGFPLIRTWRWTQQCYIWYLYLLILGVIALQIGMLKNSCKTALKELKHWMAPEKVHFQRNSVTYIIWRT